MESIADCQLLSVNWSTRKANRKSEMGNWRWTDAPATAMSDFMPHSRTGVVVLALLVSMLSLNPIGLAVASTTQASDKSLDIERYADEPLELREIRIRDQPITNKILVKFRHDNEGLDTISFKEQDGWFRHLQITLRNISSKPIYGVGGSLYFKPSHTETRFSLPLSAFTQLKQGVLEPGADVTLTVTDQAWKLTADIFKQYDINPDLASVTFSVEGVRFSDTLQWRKGRMLRPDPGNPSIWRP